ncbi:MAG: hypothetical protein AMJ53_15960 [Gammaproteobacteria bacterium SG8_11]|nr:MAG: hypothetical protein AMJ53_15960 [Gammaproteobacteria bacterium SG8_11]
MKFLGENQFLDAESAEDTETATELLKQQLDDAYQRLNALPVDSGDIERAELQLKIGAILVDLERGEEAFDIARQAFDTFVQLQSWEGAVQACDVMFQAEQDDSLAALGQGVWLAVTFPINPELTVNMLSHIVDETPDDSDGGAVAAAVARYVVDLRTEGKQHDDLAFFTNNILGSVARRHSDVQSQEQFDYWVDKLELNDPTKFLPRLRNVVDVLVQENWWVDRETIWSSLPDQ